MDMAGVPGPAADDFWEKCRNPRYGFGIFSDFGGRPATAITPNTTVDSGWYAEAIAAGSAISQLAGEADAQGILRLSTGTSSTSGPIMRYGTTDWLVPGAGELRLLCRYRVATLGDPTQRTDTRIGLRNLASTRFIQLNFGDHLGSNAFRVTANNGSGLALVATGAPIVANKWHLFEAIISNDATLLVCKHDNQIQTIHASNIPTDAMMPYLVHAKSAGATARTLDVDFFHVGQLYTTPLW